ncbi:SDR family NAD(P)-dependent oxidoreductase [Sphingomonas sp. HITSZ_GF]|uniref:SDR family NAD(P)-dependent oxidoreductase n=1 Tax=Sphingomonas sp. HITSZ_GF TaxID=3037247 RepID=UPI00240DFFC0|nr:SDR family NAD(P)-dependent oxidoreductase [Sphingomonas sp. HITSZ_GF]MDG2534413.1 SDR family NAD(P)-dependent oxidoreductase [Sphingomonas sp. HITSZ_GF]
MGIDLSTRVAIVTGAGAGLGAAHAIALAKRGAKLVVADMNGEAAAAVVAQIEAAGGEAMAAAASVTDFAAVQAMCEDALSRWGRIDILVNNAGILRDKSFAKMDLDDFRLVLDVHLMGSVNCTKAVWDTMRAQNYGRIIFTTSSSGLYGNFGQANYGAAKMALVGLMQTLAIEGERYGIRVNCLAPSAATAMTNGLYADEMLAGLGASLVSPAVVALAAEDAPSRAILLAGAGSFEQAHVTMTRGLFLGDGEAVADTLLDRLAEVSARDGERIPARGEEQYQYEMAARADKVNA